MRVLALALFVSALSPGATAQVSFGARAGLAVADVETFTGTLARDDQSPRLGLAASVFATLPLGAGLAFQPEIGYVPRGLNSVFLPAANDPMAQGSREYTRLEHVDLSLLARTSALFMRRVETSLVVGPSVALELSERTRTEFDDGTQETDETSDRFKNSDLGFVFGAEARSGPLVVDVRYTLGLTNVYIGETVTPTNEVLRQDLKHGVFAATLGVRLGR